MGPRRLYEDDDTIVDLHLSSVRYTPNPKHPDLNSSNETVLNQCDIVYCCKDGEQTKINLKKTLRGCVRKVHIIYIVYCTVPAEQSLHLIPGLFGFQ